MSEDEIISSWKENAAPAPLMFFEKVKERQKNGDSSELWKKYGHRMGNMANMTPLHALDGKKVDEQTEKFKQTLRKKVSEDPGITPLLKELLPEDFSWEEAPSEKVGETG